MPTLSSSGTDASGNIDLTGGDLTVTGSVLFTGFLNLGTPSELTISGGAVTASRSYHSIDTEADAASDDLDTINGGTTGDVLVLSPAASARDATVKDGTGNIQSAGDCVFTTLNDTIILIYNGSNWLEISRSING